MKKIIFLFFLLFIFVPVYVQESIISFEYPITNFFGGLNIKTNSLLLQESVSPDCKNVWFDEKDILSSRPGYTIYCILPDTGTFYGAWEYTRSSCEKWLIVQISSNIWASKNNGVDWTKIKYGLSVINPCNAVQYQDEMWFTNGFDDVFTFNGSAVTSYSFIPKGKYIETNLNQIYVANTYENPSAVYYSNTLSGPKTYGAWSALNQFIFDQDDGDQITGIKAYKGNMIVFKNNSTYGIYGYEYNWEQVKFSDFYGCVSQRSIRELKNDLIFLSKRGLCVFNNGVIKQIDRPIENFTKNSQVSAGLVTRKEWIQTEKNDFELGISSNVDIDFYPGEIILKTNRKITIQYPPEYDPVDSKTYGWRDTEWKSLSALHGNELPPSRIKDLPKSNYYFIDNISIKLKRGLFASASTYFTMNIKDNNNNIIAKDRIFIDYLGTENWYTFFSSWSFIATTNNLKVQVIQESQPSGALFCDYKYAFKRRPVYGLCVVGVAARSLSEEQKPVLIIQYTYFGVEKLDGYFISQKFDAGSKISQWKNFIASYDTDYTAPNFFIRFATFSASSVFDNDNSSWTSINNGDLIPATTSQRYIQWKAVFTKDTQKLYSVQLQWLEGILDYQDCTSATFDNRYYISFTTAGITNDLVIIFDNNGAYWNWDIPVGNFVSYDNKLLFAKSTYDFRLYQLFQGYNDNGSTINSSWTSKYMDLGNDQDKKITQIGLTAKGAGTIFVGYKSNYATDFTTISFILSEEPDNYVVNLPVGMSRAKYWQFKIFNNMVNGWFDVIRLKIYGEIMPLRAR